MKAMFIHHSAEWLEGEFEAPQKLRDQEYLTVYRVARDPVSGRVGMSTRGHTGIWDSSGTLLWDNDHGADLCWINGGKELLSLEVTFGRCRQQKGIRHELKRIDAQSFRPVETMEICVPTGSVCYLVPGPDNKRYLVTWYDQTPWGYVMVDAQSFTQLPLLLSHKPTSMTVPAFSPDGTSIVACHKYRSGWWNDEVDDFWDYPSPGGQRRIGSITVQDSLTGATSEHQVFVDLPAGWTPDRPDWAEWDTIDGPEFVSDTQFRIWLPDDSAELLTLPLSERVEIQRPINNYRKWLY
jgi:hypothetical protein